MRWAGKIGYARETEVKPGIWDDVVVEVNAMGELVQRTEVLGGEGVLGETATTTSISVLANGIRFLPHEIKYVTKDGVRWKTSSQVYNPPRLVLYLGEVYRGPEPVSPPEQP